MKRFVVKIGSEENEVDGSGEPLAKKMKTGDFGDDESSSSDEDSLVEVKKDAFTSNTMSQILSQTIVNAFAEVSKNKVLSNSYIPSFVASSKALRITMYNCGLDSLILSDNLSIFINDQKKQTILNVATILSVWYALNFESYIDKIPKFEKLYQKSNFKKLAGEKFEIYEKRCTKPMTEAEGNKNIEMTVYEFPSALLPVLERGRSLLHHEDPK